MAAAAEEEALQAVAEGTGWTYAALWRMCTRQGALVWAEGHYNGAIKTRKTTVLAAAPGGVGVGGEEEAEEETTAAAARRRRRSRQLRELYDSLAAAGAAEADDGGGGGGVGRDDGAAAVQARRRPCAALAPEDLSETEWFYLMCASYCFPPGLGLPGKAFARRGHVWLCGANKVDSKVFSRAILARSAGIQTVACIPIHDDDVLEIGTTEKVEEDIGLTEYARSIFMDQHGIPIMPTLSGHSTSTPSTHINHQPSQTKMEKYIGSRNGRPNNNLNPEEEHIEMEDDDDIIDSETNTENDSLFKNLPLDNLGNDLIGPSARISDEPMQIETSKSLRDGCTNHVDEEIPMLMVCQNGDHPAQDDLGSWHFLYEDLINNKCLQSSAAQQDPAVLAENAHYIETLLTILRHNACRQAQAAATSNTRTCLMISKNSPFSRWNPKGTNDLRQRMLVSEGTTPQRMLKTILFTSAHTTRCSSHQWHGGEAAATQSPEPAGRDDGDGGTGRSWRGQGQAQASELCGSHVLRERQRREKLNERFIILRSLVPFVTKKKTDRTSILCDTIEYVKQLQRRIQDLESSSGASREKRARSTTSWAATMAETETTRSKVMRGMEASSSCSTSGGGGEHGGAGVHHRERRAGGAPVPAQGRAPAPGHAGAAPGPRPRGHRRPGLVGRRCPARGAARKGEGGAWEEEQHQRSEENDPSNHLVVRLMCNKYS